LIDQMNLSMKQIGEQKIFLEKEHDKIKKELDTLKKQQQESENKIIRDLREKVTQNDKKLEELTQDNKHKDHEISMLNQ